LEGVGGWDFLDFFGQLGGDAKVDEFDLLRLGVNQEVGGFDVFMNDALLV
jgi:hypothetical protein